MTKLIVDLQGGYGMVFSYGSYTKKVISLLSNG